MAGWLAVLGWGSLLWEDRSIFDEWHEPWEYDGPFLRIEFSRVSSSRGGALTLVIDPENGVPVRVAWCLTRRQTINEAIEDLCKREGTKVQNIGMMAAHGKAACHDHESLAAIRAWAAERKLDGVVWTDRRSNFAGKTGETFSVDSALRYLTGLKGETRTKAVEYFQRRLPSCGRRSAKRLTVGSALLHHRAREACPWEERVSEEVTRFAPPLRAKVFQRWRLPAGTTPASPARSGCGAEFPWPSRSARGFGSRARPPSRRAMTACVMPICHLRLRHPGPAARLDQG
jgi:hypothetical protein